MRKPLLLIGLAIVLAGIGYLLLWPVPVQPLPWAAPAAPGYHGAHAVNQRLAALNNIDLGRDVGPEHIVVRDGWV